MFSAVLEDTGILRESMASIAELIDEAELVIRQDGIKLVSSDRAVVVVVDFFLDKSAFRDYNYDTDMRAGVNLLNLLRILKRAGTDDLLEIKVDKKIELKFKGSSSRKFTLPIIEVSNDELPPIDKLDFASSFEIDSSALSNAVDDADIVSDTLLFLTADNKVIINADSDQSAVELEITSLKDFKSSESSRARYSIEYLKKIIKAKKMSDFTSVAYSTDYPMKIVFNTPGKARLSFILAPRVEE
ncbi:MAG: hypothetical protein V1870_04655 [Candidatus Aenigmatarchaeota archaeon]